jgi:CubicO group peptidase (beta-lactamase class C family)
MRARITLSSIVVAVWTVQASVGQPDAQTGKWPVETPASVGLDANALGALDAEIAAGKYGNVDNMLVIRHGKAVFDRVYKHEYDQMYREEAARPGPLNAHDPSGPYNYFNPWWHPFYQRGELHTMQSVTKTVTSIVIGIASGRGEFPELDTPIIQYFSNVANVDDRKRRITIKHLLTMTSGLEWNEDWPYADPRNDSSVMEASFDWVKFTIDRPMAKEPGAAFQYSSGVTQLLSHIFRTTTHKDIEEYARAYLFEPLGITRFFWKRSPTGLVDTEGGLYLEAHDLAKLAYLYLKNGIWNGRAVVPSAWVAASIAPSATVSDSGVKYGFKWWLYPYGRSGRYAFGGSGFGGQRLIAIPEYDLVIVSTGWNLLPDQPIFTARVAIDRIIAAITDGPPS